MTKLPLKNTFMKANFILPLLVLFLFLLQGCTTFGKKNQPAHDKLAGEQVMIQSNNRELMLSHKKRDYWLEQRKKDHKANVQMHAALATGEAQAAEGLARQVLSKSPGDRQGLIVLTSALISQKKYELAAYYGRQLEKQAPNHPVALNAKGLAILASSQSQVEDYKLAAQYFAQAFQENSTEVAAGLNLAHLYLELGRPDLAQSYFSESAQRCNNCTVALVGIGTSALRLQQYKAAEQAFLQVISQKPKHTHALYYLALIHKNGYNDFKKAEDYLKELLNLRSKDVQLVEKAQSVLQNMRAERPIDDERFIAGKGEGSPSSDAKDLEIINASFLAE